MPLQGFRTGWSRGMECGTDGDSADLCLYKTGAKGHVTYLNRWRGRIPWLEIFFTHYCICVKAKRIVKVIQNVL